MAEQITVAIPAYNEEALIGRTLGSIHGQVFSGAFNYDITIACNGCTDGTAEAARDAIAQFESRPEVSYKVTESLTPSKTKALKKVMAASSSPIFMYTDADVTFSVQAFDSVAAKMQDPAISAAGAIPRVEIPQILQGTPVGDLHRAQQLYIEAARFVPVPLGRMLAYRPSELDQPIPEGVIAEDRFITLSLNRKFGWQSVVAVQDTAVYGLAPRTEEDFLLQLARDVTGREQFAELFPELHKVKLDSAALRQKYALDSIEAFAITRDMLVQENIDPSTIDKLQELQAKAKELGHIRLKSLRETGKWERIESTKVLPE